MLLSADAGHFSLVRSVQFHAGGLIYFFFPTVLKMGMEVIDGIIFQYLYRALHLADLVTELNGKSSLCAFWLLVAHCSNQFSLFCRILRRQVDIPL